MLFRSAKARAVEAKAAAGQEERVGELKQELAWAYVGEKEDVRADFWIFELLTDC